MTDTHESRLSWDKTRDAIVLGVGALLVGALGILIRGQTESNTVLGEVKRDLAVLSSETRRDREEVTELKGRVKIIEVRLFDGARQ